MRKGLLCFVVFGLLVGSVAFAGAGTRRRPFKALWHAIAYLQEQLDNIQLLPGPEGAPGFQGERGEQGIQGKPGSMGLSNRLLLEDGIGQELGILISTNSQHYEVYNISMDVIFSIKAGIYGKTITPMTSSQIDVIYFHNFDCVGMPLVPASDYTSHHDIAVIDNRYYSYAPTAPVYNNHIIRSQYNRNNRCSNNGGLRTNVIPMIEVFPTFSLPLVWPPTIVVN